MAYTPPIMEMARAVEAQKPYRGRDEPVETTFSTREGRKKYRGMEPAVKIMKVLRRPMASETAAQIRRPPAHIQYQLRTI